MTSFPIPNHPADRVLVASPSPVVRQRVLESLRSAPRFGSTRPRRFEQASGGAEALSHLESGFWQVLFLDRRLPDLDAEELSHTVRRRFPAIEVVMLDAERAAGSEGEDAAAPVLPPDNSLTDALLTDLLLPAILASDFPRSLTEAAPEAGPAAASQCAEPLPTPEPLPGMIGTARAMQPVYRLVRLLAPRNTAVLITGPTGCGKELVARAIHQLSPRAGRLFAVVNCAAIPETLLEAELFGYARGAFTGAIQAYGGRIQAAQGGTLFLDEIGEMPLSLQPKLLRFLEQKELQRLGSAEVVRVDTRVVSATNAHLLSLVREGKFREDLYYRLCGFPMDIPALRERSEDVAQLAAHFLRKYAAPAAAPTISLDALRQLRAHPWPGNIRELQNVVERALILSEGEASIGPQHLLLGDAAAGR